MICVKIRSNLDQTLSTMVESKLLVLGEVTSVCFRHSLELEEYVKIGAISIAKDNEPESKLIPSVG
jgi:hypothetical protein